MNKKIRNTGIAAVMGCICLAGMGSTLAYFTSTDQVTNKFTTGDQKVELREPDWNPEEGDGKNIYPGYSVYKNPTIKNTASDKNGEEPSYARMVINIKDQVGNVITDPKAIELICSTIRYDETYTGSFSDSGTGKKIEAGRIPGYSLQMLKDIPMINPDFVLDTKRSKENRLVFNYMGAKKDGILDIGEQAVLFTDIVIPTDWTRTEMECVGDFVLDVEMESIQARGFADQEAAFTALDGDGAYENK